MASPSNPSPAGRVPRSRAASTPGQRTVGRPRGRTSQSRATTSAAEDSGRLANAVGAAGRVGGVITWRLIAVIAVLAVLLYMLSFSLRVYFNQQRQIADAKAQLQATQQMVDDLSDQLERWNDPAYVKAQARDRLGWVMPGEVGYQVIGPDGKPLGAGAEIGSSSSLPAGEQSDNWWDRLAGSIMAADDPVPLPDESSQPPITVSTPPR